MVYPCVADDSKAKMEISVKTRSMRILWEHKKLRSTRHFVEHYQTLSYINSIILLVHFFTWIYSAGFLNWYHDILQQGKISPLTKTYIKAHSVQLEYRSLAFLVRQCSPVIWTCSSRLAYRLSNEKRLPCRILLTRLAM